MEGVAVVKLDKDTEDEYWVLGNGLRFMRKQTSTAEVFLTGYLAGHC